LKKTAKNIIVWFLLLGFLTPTITNILHSHEQHILCNAKNDKYLHTHHDKCEICSFISLLFNSKINKIDFNNNNENQNFCNNSIGHLGLIYF